MESQPPGIVDHVEAMARTPVAKLLAAIQQIWALLAFVCVIGWAIWQYLVLPDLHASYAVIDLQPIGLHGRASSSSSRHLILLSLRNNTPRSIADVEVQIVGVRQIERVTVTSSSPRLSQATSEQAPSTSAAGVFVPDISAIPPRGTIQMMIWCTVNDRVFGHPISLHSDAGSERISRLRLVGGIGEFVDGHLATLTFLVMATLLMLTLRAMRRVSS